MKVIAVNGSPRKEWNTASLLNRALEGAASQGAETELVNLYDLEFKGCVSCFACKRKGGKSYGRCGWKDGLTPVLERIAKADALVMGSPIYLSEVTGEMRSFWERLIFPYLVYDKEHSAIYPGRTRTAWIFTMNIPETNLENWGYTKMFQNYERMAARTFGSAEPSLVATDTYQFDDYSKYVSSAWDPAAKAKRKAEVFPQDLQKAYDLGVRLATRSE